MSDSSTCSHNCGECASDCADRTDPQSFIEKTNDKTNVKKVIGIVSGKGGVGKSLVTSLLASAVSKQGKKTAVLDADITGPSIPKLFGVKGQIMGDENGLMLPLVSEGGVSVMSVNLMLDNDTDPVVWRGPVIAGVVRQFWTDVVWGDVDFMFVDMPPGTGDVPLTVFQSLPVDGIVVVASPQELVGMIVSKAVKMAGMMNIPVLGLVENMAYFECPSCGQRHAIFGESHAWELAKEYNIPSFCQIPIDPQIARLCDAGQVEKIEEDHLAGLIESFI